MPDRTCITMSFLTPLFFRYHLLSDWFMTFNLWKIMICQQLTRHVRTAGLWLESEVNQLHGFLHRFAFPYFLTRFLTDFFIYNTQISTENIYRILIKQTTFLAIATSYFHYENENICKNNITFKPGVVDWFGCRLDYHPYWECGSGSRKTEITKINK